MATVTLTLEEYEALKDMAMGNAPIVAEPMSTPHHPRKTKRKVSKYGREFGRQLKALKAKHPRTNVRSLMSKAHRATKKAMK